MGWDFTNRERGISNRAYFEQHIGLAQGHELVDFATAGQVWYAAVREPSGQVTALVIKTQRARGYFNFVYKTMDEGQGPTDTTCPERILDLLSDLPEDCGCDGTVYCLHCHSEIEDTTGIWMSFAEDWQTPEVTGPRCYSGYLASTPLPADGGKPFHAPGGHNLLCSVTNARTWRAVCRKHIERTAVARTVTPGTVVKFPREIEFSNGWKSDTFTFKSRNIFLLHGSQVRLTGWRSWNFEVIEKAA